MRKPKHLILMISLAAFLLLTFTGCNSPKSKYDTVKEAARTNLQEILDNGGTSVSYAVMQDGKIILSDAVGYLDGNKQKPVTTDTLYNIGSVSKVVCAAAVMKLVDDGKVKLDDPVISYLPEFKMEDSRYKDITVRMLLDHSSGLPGTNYTIGISYNKYDEMMYKKVYDSFEISSLKADPGKFSVYCNDGFMLAEMLVAKVSGKTYSDFVKENIFTPIGAGSSGFADRDFAPGSYAVQGTKPHEYANVMGSGGISTSISDLCKFGQIFLDKEQGVLTESSIKEISAFQGKTFIPVDTLSAGYGLGWDSVSEKFEKYDFGEGVLAKSGGTSQFTSQLYVIPQCKIVCAISVTSDFSGSAASMLCDITADVLRVQGIDVSKVSNKTAAEHKPLPGDFKSRYAGLYGAASIVMRVTANNDDSITTELFNGKDFSIYDEKLYFDGTAFVNESGEKIYEFTEADGRKYIISINEGHDGKCAMGQKLEPISSSSDAWKTRLGKLYLPAYAPPDSAMLSGGLTLYELDTLDGILIAEQDQLFSPMGIRNDSATEMILQVPGNLGRDLYTLRVKTVNGEEWLYNESYDLRPADELTVLKQGLLTIDHNWYNTLYKIPKGELTFTVPEGGRVIAYDSSGSIVYDSVTNGVSAFDMLPNEGYIQFLGNPGAGFTVTVD